MDLRSRYGGVGTTENGFAVNKLRKQQNGGEIAINSTHSILKMLVVFIWFARPANGIRKDRV